MPVVKFLCAVVGALFFVVLLVEPACACTNYTSARYASMRADLRNLTSAQEQFYEDSARFARSMDELLGERYSTSAYVSVTLTPISDTVWTAVATHSMLSADVRCEIANADEVSRIAALSGEPACDPPYKKRRWRLRTVW